MTDQPPRGTSTDAGDAPGTNWRDEAMPDHETRPERDSGGGIVGEGGTAAEADPGTTDDAGDLAERVDPDGLPAAAFDRRTMDAEGGDAERNDPDQEAIQLPSG